ncbi:hypothetical protein OG21DRAFT_814790 [Imleria badia]|nr:hypothetical protein OG21DRAFT_814790 [Imleria badia]
MDIRCLLRIELELTSLDPRDQDRVSLPGHPPIENLQVWPSPIDHRKPPEKRRCRLAHRARSLRIKLTANASLKPLPLPRRRRQKGRLSGGSNCQVCWRICPLSEHESPRDKERRRQRYHYHPFCPAASRKFHLPRLFSSLA